MFYNKNIEIWIKGKKEKNNIGQIVETPPSKVKEILVDVQPYSREEILKDYGFTVDCSKRIFMDLEDININTNLIKYKNRPYDIKKIIEWDDYLEVFMNEI